MMRFTCDLQELLHTVSNAAIAVSGRSNLPILDGVLLELRSNQLTVTGYDMEIGIVKTIEVNMQVGGEVVINAKLLADILRKIPSEQVIMETDANFVTRIYGDDVTFQVSGMDPKEYPEMPKVDDERTFSIPESLLKKMISQTLFAVATNQQNPVHTGALFDIKDGDITIVAVDGYRLAVRRETVPEQGEFSFVVPGRTLSELSKILADDDERIADIHISESKHILFAVNGYTIISRLIAGEFLDYHEAIPKESEVRVRLAVRSLQRSVERATVVIQDRAKSPVIFETAQENIAIFCESGMGQFHDRFPAEIEGGTIKLGFNSKYMIDVLKNVDTDEVEFAFTGPLAAIKITPVSGDAFVYLVLPVRLGLDR